MKDYFGRISSHHIVHYFVIFG